MDIVSYVSNVGNAINESTKYNIDVDKISIKNIILIKHLTELIDLANDLVNSIDYTEPVTLDDINKLKGYINCLKKEINFYPVIDVVPDCILTETEEHIIQE